MAHLIDKDALIAEIEKLKNEVKPYPSHFCCGRLSICNELTNFIDTLEVKEIEELTDVFIKKACEKLKKCMYDNLMFQGRLHREEVIETFVRDFKKYMEEQQ